MRLAKILVLGSMALTALVLVFIVCSITFRFLLRVAGLEEAYRAAFPDSPDPDAAIARELGPRVPAELQEWIWIQLGNNGRLDAVGTLIDLASGTPGTRMRREGRVFHLDLSDLGLWQLSTAPKRSDSWSVRLDLDDNAICSESAHTTWLDTAAPDWISEQDCSLHDKEHRAKQWLGSMKGIRRHNLSFNGGRIDSLYLQCADSGVQLRLDLLVGAGLHLDKFEISHCALERRDIRFLSQMSVGELRLRQVVSPTLDLSIARGIERIDLDSGRVQWFVPPYDLEAVGVESTIRTVARSAVSVRGLRLEHPFARGLLADLGISGDRNATDTLPGSLAQAWLLDSLWSLRYEGQDLSPSGDFDTIRLLLGDPQSHLARVAGPVRPLQRPCPSAPGPDSHDPFYHSLFLVGPAIVRIPVGPEFAVGDFRYVLAKDTLRSGLSKAEVKKILGKPGWIDDDWFGYAHRKPFSGRITLYLWLHFDSEGKLDGMRESPEAKPGC